MTNWLAGMRLTAARLYETDLIGRTVFLANRGTGQSISSGTDSASNAVQWDEVTFDVLGGWSAGQPTRWTCPRAGWWTFQGAVGFNSSTGGTVRECCWYVNGGLISMGRSHPINMSSIASGALTVDARAVPRLMSVGDYVQLVAGQNSGSALDTATGSYRPYISITYSGPP
ncbi:hypothetical protein ACGF3J_37295 [Streptomyces sp. NPDC048171]|uniref:hypothetical protein n=1 Tax=Streptomyces sp. NPDC048171 TaxID=3365504 RepID=UPI003715926C